MASSLALERAQSQVILFSKGPLGTICSLPGLTIHWPTQYPQQASTPPDWSSTWWGGSVGTLFNARRRSVLDVGEQLSADLLYAYLCYTSRSKRLTN
jgi:hypothetical protein